MYKHVVLTLIIQHCAVTSARKAVSKHLYGEWHLARDVFIHAIKTSFENFGWRL